MTRSELLSFKLVNALLDALSRFGKRSASDVGAQEWAPKLGLKFNPVTRFDVVAEASAFNALKLIWPSAVLQAEEVWDGARSASTAWVLDPIDGTRAFVCGSPVWGRVLAMCRDGCIQLGAVDHPVVGERLVAVGGQTYYRRGDGAFGALKVVGQAKRLEACVLATSSVAIMPASAKAAFLDVSSRALHVVYDHDCYAFTLLAKGKVDAVVEFGLKPCDFAGLVPVLASAGCQVLNWHGRAVGFSPNIIAVRSAEVGALIAGAIAHALKAV